MKKVALTVLTGCALLLILLAVLLGYDAASPQVDLTAYAPNAVSTASEVVTAITVYLVGAALLTLAARLIGHENRESSASLVALAAIAAIPISALLAFYHYWLEVIFVVLAIVVIVAPMALGFRRTA
jgi:magnesium-transporting ATPase (P-type)